MRTLTRVCSLLIAAVCWAGVAAGPGWAQSDAASDAVVPSADVEAAQGEYQGELPPVIDRKTFFGDPQYRSAQISPNGEYVSFMKEYKGKMNVWVKGVDEPFDAAEPVTADTTRPVPYYFWSQDSRRILYVQDKGGNENFHVYAVNVTSDEETDLGVPPATDLTPYEDVQARIYDVPEGTPGEIIVGINDRKAQYHDVYRVDLETGERELVYKNESGVASWHTDLEGTLRLASRQTDDGGTEILRVMEDTLKTVYSCSFEESCGVVRFHKDNERVYMSTNKGEADLQRLVLFNPKTQETELVEEDPEGEVDFGGAQFSDATDELVATYYRGDRKRVYPKDEEFAADYQFLKENLDGEISIQSGTEDESTWVVSASSDVDPGSVYLFEREDQELTRLYRSRPDLPSEHLATMKAIEYEARDGLTIPAYLTLPKGVEAKNLPVIVFPHGGPWARDTWGYDSFAQFFANRGYAVLQPNFRGSTGYGQEFLNAGNNEWGTGAMQHDLTDGVQYLIDQGIADPDRVGITGISYGGYATLAGLTFTPDVYAAGASYVGPSNLLTLLESIPPYWKPIKKMLTMRMGNPEDPEEKKRLKKQSPFFHAETIDDPLLVIQGANDPRVKKQESDQIVVAARENDVPVQYLVAPEEGHGFRKENNRLAVAAKMEMFFGQHLGGRYQTSVSDPVQTRLDTLTVDPASVTLPEDSEKMAASAEKALAAIDGSTLKPATLNYDVTMKMRGRSIDLSSTRTVAKVTSGEQPMWAFVDRTETPRATVVDSLLTDGSTLRPMEHHLSGPMTLKTTYTDTSATGTLKMRGRSTSIDKTFKQPVLAGGTNVHLALAAMPLEKGFTTTLRSFNEQRQKVQTLTFEVTGTETVKAPSGSHDTFVVKMKSADGNTTGTMHLTKKAPHHIVKATIEQSSPRGTQTFEFALTSMGEG
jgi:dipeptidyl aminopeptidase/acylaminoacyl peptidase